MKKMCWAFLWYLLFSFPILSSIDRKRTKMLFKYEFQDLFLFFLSRRFARHCHTKLSLVPQQQQQHPKNHQQYFMAQRPFTLTFTVEFYPYVYNRPIGRWLYSPCVAPLLINISRAYLNLQSTYRSLPPFVGPSLRLFSALRPSPLQSSISGDTLSHNIRSSPSYDALPFT